MSEKNEEQRITLEYNNRDKRMPWYDWKTNIYHPRHPLGSLINEHNHEILIQVLNRLDLDLTEMKILDVGCGFGYWLRYFVELGANPNHCYGVDLSELRIDVARQKNPAVNWYHNDIEHLPFPDKYFDFVMQAVAFSSIQNSQMRLSCAREINRVVRDGGLVLWLDLINAKSDQLIPFAASEVKKYFPAMKVVFQKFTFPIYFRHINGKYSWLSKLAYHFTYLGCESQLIVFRKPLND
jgi:ubiquinone/menaquinone biosynthesis C-methylase UbiE